MSAQGSLLQQHLTGDEALQQPAVRLLRLETRPSCIELDTVLKDVMNYGVRMMSSRLPEALIGMLNSENRRQNRSLRLVRTRARVSILPESVCQGPAAQGVWIKIEVGFALVPRTESAEAGPALNTAPVLV
jgi:hypothetical protein